MKMISKIRFFIAVFFVFLFAPFCILNMYICPHSRAVRRAWATSFMRLFRVKFEVIGEPDLEAKMIIMNHQSFMDVIYLEAYAPQNICWVAKQELGKVPLYGHMLKAHKMILIDRESKKEMVRMLKLATERSTEDRCICIFPEGTRSKGEENFLPFKSGAKVLAEKLNCKVQPVVFCGTRKNFNMGEKIFTNTKFFVKYLPSFYPNSGESCLEFMAENSVDSIQNADITIESESSIESSVKNEQKLEPKAIKNTDISADYKADLVESARTNWFENLKAKMHKEYLKIYKKEFEI